MKHRQKLVLASCCSAHAVQDGLGAVMYVLLPILAQAFGLGYSQVGVIRAANNTAMMLLEIPSGVLAERFGERALLVFGLFAAGVGYLSLSLATGFLSIFLSLFVVGFGAAFQHALSSAVITRTYPIGRKRTALGVYNSSGDFGKLAATGGFSLLIGMGLAWQGIVVAYGCLALVTAVMLFVVLRRLDVGSPPVDSEIKSTQTGPIGWGITDRSGFAGLAGIVCLDTLVQGSFLTFLAFLMIEKEVPTGLAALAVVVTLAGGMFGKLGCGMLADHFGVIRSLVVVECLTAIGIVAVTMSSTLVAFCLLPLVGLVLQGSSSITYATVGDLVDGERQSRGFALIYAVSSGASIIGPILLGLLGDGFGLSVSMYAMALIVLIPIPLTVLLRPALRTRPA